MDYNAKEQQSKPELLKKEDLNRQWQSLIDNTQKWKNVWKDLKAFINPHLGFFEEDTANNADRDDEELVNSIPVRANTIQAAGMYNGITSPSRPWFKLKISNKELSEIDAVKYWLADTETTMYSVFAKSNFYNSAHQYYAELGAFGTAAMIALQDLNEVVRFKTLTAGEYALGVDDAGRVNRFAREIRMTVSQIVEKWGIDKVPAAIKTAYERKNFNEWYKVKHLIIPNLSKDPNKMTNRNMEYSSIYWMDQCEEGQYLSESGFREFPVMAARWMTTGPDIYGKGPGWTALPDSKMVQVMTEDLLRGMELTVKPPMTAPTSALQAGGVNILPGGVSPYSAGGNNDNAIRPAFQVSINFPEANNVIKEYEQKILDHFFANLFLMLEQIEHGSMTAREVMERSQEKMAMIGPVLERLQGEFLRPLITRVFNLMLQVPGLVSPPPEEIQGMTLEIEYISVLAQAQRMTGITAIEQFANFAIGMAQANPGVLDKFDFDAALDAYGESLGVPPRLILGDDKVQALRDQRQKQQQMQAAMEQANQASQAAKNLGQINTGENNALTALLGMPGGAGP